MLPALPIGDRSNTAALRAALGNLYSGKKGQFGGISILPDGSNVNPVALNILQAKAANGGYLIPSSPTGAQQPFPFSVPAIYNEYQYMGNGDYMLSSRHTFASRYFFTTDPQTADFVAGCNNICLPGTGAKFIFTTTSLNEKVTSILTNNLVNEARFSMLRSLTNDTTNTINTAQSVGITPLNSLLPVNGTTAPSPIPVMLVQGLFQAGGSNFDFQKNSVTQFQYSEQLSWTHGKHTVRAGFEYERVRWNWNFASLGKGQLIFSSFPDFLLGLPGCTPGNTTCNANNPGATNGSPFSNINATILASRLSTAGLVHAYRATDSAAFVNDDYKVNSRLTVNLGVRWEFDGLVEDKYGNLTSVFPTEILKVAIPGNTPATGSFAGYVVPANYKDSANPPLPSGVLVNSQNIAPRNSTPLNNFAPRFGFAWQPGSGNKFVVRGGFGMFYNRIPGDSFTHSVQEAQPYSTPAGKGGASNYFSSLAQPFAAGSLGWSLSRWVDLTTGNGSGISQTTVQEIFVTPVTYSWNLNAQYEFLPSWVLEVGYVGSHGIHQNNTHPINTAQLASVSNPLYGIVTTNLRSNVPARVPYLGFSAATLSQESTDGDYKFNSLQATVRKQYSHGLTFQAAYTFSRAFANYAASTTSGRVSNDPLDSRQQYGLNANYRPHRLVLSYNWNIPTRKISGVAEKLIGGWSLSGLTPIQDGQPLTLTDTRGGTIYGQPGTSRAQINPGFTYADVLTPGDVKSNLNNYFNKAALGLTPVIGDGTGWGNTGIGIAFGPGQFDWDIALAKRTRVGGLREAPELQFRAEAVNLFNHAQFLNPGLAGNQGNFGLITGSSVNPRLLQLALKYVF